MSKDNTIDSYRQILEHLDTYGVVDKDKDRAHEDPAQAVQKKILPRKKKPAQQMNRVDLHGMTVEQAIDAVYAAMDTARREGVKTVCLIHGRGMHSAQYEGPILKPAIRDLLQHQLQDRIASWRPAKPREGGMGATMVFLP